MWLFNKKTIILDLPKLTYKCWEEVRWNIKFDFWDEKVKADKITIGLIRTTNNNSISVSEWVKAWHKVRYEYLLETNLLWKGEYSKEEIPFTFIIPYNAIPDDISFDMLLSKIPKGFRKYAEILIDMFLPNMRKRYSFKITARIDIPWAVDIRETVAINVIPDTEDKKENNIKKEVSTDNKDEILG